MRYRLHGLEVESVVELTGAPTRTAAPAALPPVDVQILAETGPLPLSTRWQRIDAFTHARPGGLHLQINEDLAIRVEDGTHITVARHPRIDHDMIETYLLGSGLGLLLHQRGRLVLHANAVVVADGCLAVAGPSGAGKSTLAAAFAARGFAVLSDDVTPVTTEGLVHPGVPRIKLWRDAVDRLDLPMDSFRPVVAQPGKHQITLPPAPDAPMPLRAVYVMEGDDATTYGCVALGRIDSFAALAEHTYRRGTLVDPEMLRRHTTMCARLGLEVPVIRIDRPTGRTPEQTVDAVLADYGRRVPTPGESS